MNEGKLIAVVDAITSREHPCSIKGASCRAGEINPCCYGTRFKREDPADNRCLYLGPNGCENVNFECKVWFCETAIRNMNPCMFAALKSVESIGIEFGFVNPPFLGDAYVGADKPA